MGGVCMGVSAWGCLHGGTPSKVNRGPSIETTKLFQ